MHCGGGFFVRAAITVVVLALSIASPARACLWDSDTLRDERIGLPGIAEVLAGRYERHSAFFYEDRAKRAAATVERDPQNLAAWDDLAVAYDKLGQLDRAVETIERKAALKPGLYTTEANWGTFLVHRGDYEAGLAHLRRALEINPDAHFGRERYQVMAVEYLLAGKADPAVFDRGSFAWPILLASYGLTTTQPDVEDADSIVRRAVRRVPGHKDEAIESAIEGVVGMLRFGPGTSPHLYAALGDLLIGRGDFHLAYRAFARARDAGHPSSKWIDERLEACRDSSEWKGDFDDAQIAGERAAGERWAAKYQAYEDDLIRRDVAVTDATLLVFYKEHGPARQSPGRMGFGELRYKLMRSTGGTIATIAFVGVVALLVLRGIRRVFLRKQTPTAS